MRKKLYGIFLIVCLTFLQTSPVHAEPEDDSVYAPPEITAPYAIMIDADTGLVIYDKECDTVCYPASLTKIMTALLALEHYNGDLDARIDFTAEDFANLPFDASIVPMYAGDTLSLDEALYGLLLVSGNEVANALARNIAGDIEDFAVLMTMRAKELGAKNSSFKNPSGLHDLEHYTTAYDMALIMREAVKHPEFVKYISSQSFKIKPTEMFQQERELVNTNKLIQDGALYDPNVLGSKTGFTDEAMYSLVTYGKKNGHSIITVVMRDEKNVNFTDTTILLNYGFSIYAPVTLVERTSYYESQQVFDRDGEYAGYLNLGVDGDVVCELPMNIYNSGKNVGRIVSLNIPKNASEAYKGIIKGDVVGKLNFTLNGVLIASAPLIASDNFIAAAPQTDLLLAGEDEADADEAVEVSSLNGIVSVENNAPANVLDSNFIYIIVISLIVVLVIFKFAVSAAGRRKRRYKGRYYY